MKVFSRFYTSSALREILALAALALGAFTIPTLSAQEATGSVTGQVNDADNGLYLYGVQVEVAGTNWTTLTDRDGRYYFDRLPAGEHTLVFTYTGSEPQRKTVSIVAGKTASVSVELRPDVVKLEAFVVTGEREGDAASITRQRNAPNVKNVVAIDALGRMTNENTGELLMRLPGIVGEIGGHGTVDSVTIRGIVGEYNNMTVDGIQQGNTYTERRMPRTDMLSGALFEEIEVTKSHTPDMPADGLGGSVNVKTRGPLSMSGKRRIYYRMGGRYAAPFYDHIPLRDGRLIHPLFNITYNEVFSVGSGVRNLGVSLNMLYSEQVSSYYRTVRSFEETMESPAFVRDFTVADIYNNRKQKQASLKLEYKISNASKIWMNFLYADSADPWHTGFVARAYVAQSKWSLATLGPDGQPNGGGAILPGYTDDVTSVWGEGGRSTRFRTQSYVYGWDAYERQISVGGEHRDGPFSIDYSFGYFRSSSHHDTPKCGDRPAGGYIYGYVDDPWWRLDMRASKNHPVFTQTGGDSSIYDPASYTALDLVARDSVKFNKSINAGINAKYVLPFPSSPMLKAGIHFRRQDNGDTNINNRYWNSDVAGTYASLVDPSIVTSFDLRDTNHIPWVNVTDAAADVFNNPGRWTEDLYYETRDKYRAKRNITENVSAAYLQTQFRLGRLFALAGARVERTDVDSHGFIQSRTLSTNAERATDPVYFAKRDFNNPVNLESSYTHVHPSIHLKYQITKNLLARLSWSNSIGRPRYTELYPGLTVDDINRKLSVNNPDLKPEESENWDVSLEYYFEPVGQISAGYFRKNLSGFIVRDRGGVVPDDPSGPYYDYNGYDLYWAFNGGSATIDGWELNWRQRLSFLPGLLRGLTVAANFTALKTSGDYGSPEEGTAVTDLVGFVPRSANFIVNYGYRGFSVRLMANHRSSFLWAWSSEPSQVRYAYARTTWNLSFNYEMVRRKLIFFLDFDNLTEEPLKYYTLRKERLDTASFYDSSISFGIRGSF